MIRRAVGCCCSSDFSPEGSVCVLCVLPLRTLSEGQLFYVLLQLRERLQFPLNARASCSSVTQSQTSSQCPLGHLLKHFLAASVGENASLGTAKTFCKQNNGSLRTVIYPESITVQAPRYGHRGTKRRGFRGTRTAMVAPTSLAIMIGEYKTM